MSLKLCKEKLYLVIFTGLVTGSNVKSLFLSDRSKLFRMEGWTDDGSSEFPLVFVNPWNTLPNSCSAFVQNNDIQIYVIAGVTSARIRFIYSK